MIDPRSLRTYLVVCREKSISAAARRLHVTQPAVSMAISHLEAALSTHLFDRGRGGIVLTDAGRRLMRRAEAMENLLLTAEEEVGLSAEGLDGPLYIGGTPGALANLVPGFVKALTSSGRHFALRVLERSDEVLIELLRQGRIEIAIVTTGMGAVPDGIEEQTIAADPFEFVVGKAHANLPKQVSLRRVRDLPWVLPDAQGGFHRQVDALFVLAGVPLPREVVHCDSLLTTKAIVREGRHVTLLPGSVVAEELAHGTLRAIRIREARISRTVGIRKLAGAKLTPLATQFLETVTAANTPK